MPRRPVYPLALAESLSEEPTKLASLDETQFRGTSLELEEPEGEEIEAEMQQFGVLPLFACGVGAALAMLSFVVVKARRSVGSSEQKAPLMES